MNPAMQRLFSLLIILTMWQAGVGLTFAKEPGAGLKAERIALPAQKQNLPAPANDQIGKRYALVIGNSDYKSVGKLTNPVSDARAMCKTLRALQFEVDCRENLQHRGAFKEAVSDFTRKIQPNDVALFYLSLIHI